MTEVALNIGAIIVRRRRQLALTQTQLAAKTSLHRTYISDLEKGTRNISLKTLLSLASAIDMKPGELLQEALES